MVLLNRLLRCRSIASRLLGVLAFAMLLVFCWPGKAAAQSQLQAPEPRVKAAFLFKFGSYVEWPSGTFASASAPITIGVMDADELAGELAAIVAGRDIDGRSVVVRKLRDGDPITGLNIIFIGKAVNGKLAGILSPMKGRPTLAVTESEGALELGSMINFVVIDGKVRFDVSLQPAAAGSLKISSRLLAVARKVMGAS
jgi:hypothetical protein